MNIRFVKLKPNAKTPQQATKGDAGYDLFSTELVKINPFETKVIKTGIAVEIPEGYYGRIAPRSGLAVKSRLDVMAGVVDSGYRNELGVVLINFNVLESLQLWFNGLKNPQAVAFAGMFEWPGAFTVNPGDKIAQLIIEKCHDVTWEETDSLSESQRGQGGFGSTGT